MCDMCNRERDFKSVAAQLFLNAAIAQGIQIRSVNLAEIAIPLAIIDLVPESMARQYVVIPFELEAGVLQVAISDPMECEKIDLLKYYLNREIQPAVAPREQIIEAIDKYYR